MGGVFDPLREIPRRKRIPRILDWARNRCAYVRAPCCCELFRKMKTQTENVSALSAQVALEKAISSPPSLSFSPYAFASSRPRSLASGDTPKPYRQSRRVLLVAAASLDQR